MTILFLFRAEWMMCLFKLALVLLSLYVFSSNATVRIDISSAIPRSGWDCLRKTNSFAIVRAFRSSGSADPNAHANILNAKAAGFANVDAYLFPDFPKGGAAAQVDQTHAAISGTGYGMLWLDIERLAWGSNLQANRDFIEALINRGKALGIKMGIYSNYNNWAGIVGISWNYPASQGLPIWYAHYDGVEGFGDFTPFGGWTKPAMKQYLGDKSDCGYGVDFNWY